MASKDARKVANGTGRVRRSLPATPVLSSDSGSRSRESLGVTSNPHSAARAGLVRDDEPHVWQSVRNSCARNSVGFAEAFNQASREIWRTTGTSRPAGVREEVRREDDREVEVDPPAEREASQRTLVAVLVRTRRRGTKASLTRMVDPQM
jgi:hypothetical protein